MKKGPSFRRDRMRLGIYVLPNLFTTANLFCGFYSIIASMKEMYEIAAVSILIAAVLDGLDGRIARMTHTTSKFGGEYDSLCDLVAFGVAPAILIYSWSLISYGKWGWLAAFLFVACGALRLARFNVQVGIIDSRVFNGLPIPGGAAVVATGVMLFFYLGGEGRFSDLSILAAIVAVSLFMVSSIKYYSFKDLNFFSRKPFMSFVLIILILVIVVAEPQIMLFTLAFGYGVSGPAWTLYRLSRKRLKEKKAKDPQYQDHPL
ncbi:MAG: CDP-diacylglycerol--serine O-phosphatidyltransferase [Proteobacteria bacterium]|nr:CDP-diacylglycerol--serine O-phosphatidyltransferase [Pseudomonadota bacterium]MBU2260889.1 CDP-diacylglycerol--serine O-phosphatidyltransferase [Pseudomonadota bacterium]